MRRPHLHLFVWSLALLAACGGGGGDDGRIGTPTEPADPPPPPTTEQPLCPPGGDLTLAVGEQIIVQNQTDYCFNFGSSGSVTEYLVGVQSVGEGGVAVRDITVTGDLVTTTALQASAAPAV